MRGWMGTWMILKLVAGMGMGIRVLGTVGRRRRRFRIDRGPLRGSSSPLTHFEPARVKPN